MFKAAFKTDRIWHSVVFLIVLVLLLARLPLLVNRGFDPDEFQHLHGGYCVSEGQVPYRDYYEHHPPGSPWLLSVLVHLGGHQWGTVLAARALMFVLCAVALLITYRALRLQAGAQTAITSLVLLSGTLLFLQKSLEIRPDVPALLCWMGGLYLSLVAFKREQLRRYALAGVVFGLGFLFTPKLAFGLIGLCLGLLWACVKRLGMARFGKALLAPLILGSCALLPLLCSLPLLAAQGALDGFVHNVIVMSVGWPQELLPSVYLREFIEQNPFIFLLGLVGFLRALWRSRAGGSIALIAGSAATLVVGWFVIPVPWPQYLLPLFPLWAYFAAGVLEDFGRVLLWTVTRCRVDAGSRRGRLLSMAAALGAAVMALAVQRVLGDGRPAVAAMGEAFFWGAGAAVLLSGASRRSDRARQLWFMGTVVVLTVLLMQRLSASLVLIAPTVLLLYLVHISDVARRPVAVLLLVCLAMPLAQIDALARTRNTPMRTEFEAIMHLSTPNDTVLTGWRGCAVFRPHAYRYFFLHDGMLRVLDDEDKGARVMQVLTSAPPELVIYDQGVRSLSAAVNSFVTNRYEATGVGDIWLRASE